MSRAATMPGGGPIVGLVLLIGGCSGTDGRSRDSGAVADSAADALGRDGAASVDGAAATPFAVRVVSFDPGEGAGFGQDRLPEVVLGPPRGGGYHDGSKHVVSLGLGGRIVLELGTTVADGPGVDLLVFENPFRIGGTGSSYAEPGYVAVSPDGESFTEFPCEPENDPDYPGCAGVRPVLANSEENDLDATDPEMAGGDRFDLADIGVSRARFLRIRDAEAVDGAAGGKAGFEIDAVAAVHGG